MKKNNWIGAVSGGISGIIGAVLVSEFDFSILSVVIIGIIIGILVNLTFQMFK